MKILFMSSLSSSFSDENSSYMHRLISLKTSLEIFGVETDILYLGDFFFKKPALIHPLNIPVLIKYMKGYDFIHAGGTGSAYFAGIAKPFIKDKTKIIYDVHGDTVEEILLFNNINFIDKFKIFQAKIMEWVAMNRSDYFIVCSDSLKQRYVTKGIKRDKIEIIYNGVNLNIFKPAKVSKNENFTVAYAGRFQKWQGIDILLGAAELLKRQDIIFRIIGFQENDLSLKNEIYRRFDKRVDLIDGVPRKILVDYLHKSDVSIIPRVNHPALEVAFPTKFAEYISCGIPVITTKVGEIAKLTEKYNCGLVCDATPESLSKTILEAREMQYEKLFEMGMNGRKLAETELSQDRIGEQYLKFLLKI